MRRCAGIVRGSCAPCGDGHVDDVAVRRAIPVDFRQFLIRHLALLRFVRTWTVRLVPNAAPMITPTARSTALDVVPDFIELHVPRLEPKLLLDRDHGGARAGGAGLKISRWHGCGRRPTLSSKQAVRTARSMRRR